MYDLSHNEKIELVDSKINTRIKKKKMEREMFGETISMLILRPATNWVDIPQLTSAVEDSGWLDPFHSLEQVEIDDAMAAGDAYELFDEQFGFEALLVLHLLIQSVLKFLQLLSLMDGT